MMNFLKYTEYLYLIVAFISLYKVFTLWEIDREGTYIFIFFAIVSAGMFLFRRNYRKKFDQRKKDN
ncbi:MAG: hypothetical protein COA50_00785 [Flavobacteriaceae bacterium]|nr:MAG: hypothetical protein COA50_00785 [Flavobacteriaceae bacterium]